jgi:hypothetical protein
MLNVIATILVSIITSLGVISFNPVSVWDKPSNLLGTASFPTSVATLTNPGATDSVATVSHSSQHTNANDEIEAIEAKAGTGASTPTLGTLLYGNGTGSSIWSASPSITGLTLSGQGIFGSFISNASSTIIGNFNITGNSTSTNATTTNFFSTTASTTNAYGTNINGFGLSACEVGYNLGWANGVFGCQAQVGANVTYTDYNEPSPLIDKAYGSISLDAGQILQFTATCSGNTTMIVDYRWNTDTSTTTLFSLTVISPYFNQFTDILQATSTSNVVNIGVYGTGGNGCSDISRFKTLVF